jgi:RNA-splicing ligase RtcB
MELTNNIKKISDTVWEIPTTFKEGMHVPAHIYATEKLLKEMDHGVLDQVTNVATLPGQVIAHRIREVFSDIFKKDPKDLGLNQVYDVAPNTAKLERHAVNGKIRDLLVHRKGATRAFGPDMDGLPEVSMSAVYPRPASQRKPGRRIKI